jgi:hypothetical protein
MNELRKEDLICDEKIQPIAYLSLIFHPIPLFLIMLIIILFT